jgi:hypothetical protein
MNVKQLIRQRSRRTNVNGKRISLHNGTNSLLG